MKSHEFASLLCSRLCHDLLSPVGALNNGIELLADEHDPEMRARCLDLLAESARASANKLKFFRLAFGAAAASRTWSTARGEGGDRRAVWRRRPDQARWMVEEPTMSKSALKVLLNIALIAGTRWCAAAISTSARRSTTAARYRHPRRGQNTDRARSRLKQVLIGAVGEDDVAPRAAAAWLAHCLVQEGGGSIQVADGEEGMLLIGASLPA